jgi:hypothetical protein
MNPRKSGLPPNIIRSTEKRTNRPLLVAGAAIRPIEAACEQIVISAVVPMTEE